MDETMALWRSTSLPYKSCGLDPFSPEYRAWVLDVYRAISGSDYNCLNELVSTKQDEDNFRIGYPYHSGNPTVVASAYAQLTQVLCNLREQPPASILEFGAGWGNLTIPLAKTGYSVTALDIDRAFLDRLGKEAVNSGVEMSFIESDFIEYVSEKRGAYDAVIFLQSFHHCDDPLRLLTGIRENVLSENGSVYFFSEPITKDLVFPWGLRYSGESLWAIGCNKWFELGFQEDFFVRMLLRGGYWCKIIPEIKRHIGRSFAGIPTSNRLDFGDLLMPNAMESTWFPAEEVGEHKIRFSMGRSKLPSLKDCPTGSFYELTLVNYGAEPLHISVMAVTKHDVTIMPQEHLELKVDASGDDVFIKSSMSVPDLTAHNKAERILGVGLSSVRTSHG